MQLLNQALNSYFKPTTRKAADPAYAEFRAYCKAKGLTYKIARDGYIEFSDGVTFGHYGDWAETMSGHKAEAA
jgi:hypothetical protein